MANSQTRVNLVNRADLKGTALVILQKNLAASSGDAIAWKAFENPRVQQTYFFVYSQQLYVGASDAFGNPTAQLPAQPGQAFEVVADNVLQAATAQAPAGSITVHNGLGEGSTSAAIYRDGDLLSIHSGLAPGQQAEFRFSDEIFIGVASEVVQGQVLSSAIVQSIAFRLNLKGLSSIEITITGGGASPLQYLVTGTT